MPFGAWLGLALAGARPSGPWPASASLALVILAVFVPAARERVVPGPLAEEFAVLARPQVLLGLAMTVLGFGGVFAVFTYIQPLLIELAGYSEAAVSPILLVFGAGLVVGNLLGGRWADRSLSPALIGTLVLLTLALFGGGLRLP